MRTPRRGRRQQRELPEPPLGRHPRLTWTRHLLRGARTAGSPAIPSDLKGSAAGEAAPVRPAGAPGCRVEGCQRPASRARPHSPTPARPPPAAAQPGPAPPPALARAAPAPRRRRWQRPHLARVAGRGGARARRRCQGAAGGALRGRGRVGEDSEESAACE